MATTKSTPKRVSKNTASSYEVRPSMLSSNASRMEGSVMLPLINKSVPLRIAAVTVVVVIALAALAWANKGLFVAGMVNNKPIWRTELENKMLSRYGEQTMEEIINERLIADEAAKRNIVVTPAEVDAKLAEIEKTLEGITLTDALSQQGMSLPDFKKQVALQITVEKMTASVNSVSDDEINAYLETNKDILISTDEATLRTNAKETILRDKKNNAFREIFDNLKTQAKVLKFL